MADPPGRGVRQSDRTDEADMADTELGALYGQAVVPRGAVTVWAGLAGAAASLALVVGLAAWGYQLVQRDVNGVPVIRALEGPMRMAPAQPGGERMAHQGLAVNQVAAAGEAGEIADTLRLAPAAPALLDLDLPQAALAVAVPEPAPETETLTAVAATATDLAVSEALAAAETVAAVRPIPETVPGVRRSLRPPPRPVALQRPPAPAASANSTSAAAVAATPDLDPQTLPAGARLVQLGAFESPEIARAEWDRIATRFDTVMAGKSRVIQPAVSGGRTFYRLRAAGFSDLADARRFCATLVSDKSTPICVPVALR